MKKLRITVDGRAYDVEVDILDQTGPVASAPAPAPVRSAATSAPTPSAPPPARPPAAAGASAGQLASPLAGKVVEVHVKAGDSVTAGQTLITLEAMKMNTLVTAAEDGTVKEVLVAAGDMVQEGQPMLSF